MLEAISGIGDSYKGDIKLDEKDLSDLSLQDLSLHRAYLCQSARPAFNLEVFQYLALSLPSSSQGLNTEINAALEEITQMLDIADKLHRSIQALSGGEWQRVRLAGMCLQVWPTLNPYAKLLILDEPAAPLDLSLIHI